MVIRGTGIQFALVCPTQFDFLLDRCTAKCVSALNCGVGPTNGWNCGINISCEESNTVQLCCKFILKVLDFEKKFYFNLFLEIYKR